MDIDYFEEKEQKLLDTQLNNLGDIEPLEIMVKHVDEIISNLDEKKNAISTKLDEEQKAFSTKYEKAISTKDKKAISTKDKSTFFNEKVAKKAAIEYLDKQIKYQTKFKEALKLKIKDASDEFGKTGGRKRRTRKSKKTRKSRKYYG